VKNAEVEGDFYSEKMEKVQSKIAVQVITV
jgi:hypothetical protein